MQEVLPLTPTPVVHVGDCQTLFQISLDLTQRMAFLLGMRNNAHRVSLHWSLASLPNYPIILWTSDNVFIAIR